MEIKAIFGGTIFTTTAQTMSQTVPTDADWIGVILNVTAVTGTDPSVVFSIQWSLDGGTWADGEPLDEFGPITTAPTTVAKRFDAKAKYWRAVATVTGTDATFTGTANAYS